MPIYVPGKRDQKRKMLTKNRRSVVATLSLTAMVDMFTVLVVFLLQNYKTTGQVITLNEDVELPQASETKELKPSSVVTVSSKSVLLENKEIIDFNIVKEQKSWMIDSLYTVVREHFDKKEQEERQRLRNAINNVVKDVRNERDFEPEDFRKITLQADKEIDFLTIKKVMYTLTEAGATEVNFAVIQNTEDGDFIESENLQMN